MKIQHNLADVQGFELIPKEWYPAHPVEATYGDSKASIQRGSPEKMFTVTWEIDEGDWAGRKIQFDTISLSTKAAGFLDEVLDACRVERQCLSCGNTFTEGRKVSKETSKINKAGVACPNCSGQGQTTWNAGPVDDVGVVRQDADGKTGILNWRCMILIIAEKSNKPGDVDSDGQPKMYNRVEHYAPIRR